MGKLYCVYVHVSPSGKRYVGITSKKPERRWANGKGYASNKHFTLAIMKYGWDNFSHLIIVENVSKQTACDLEKALIREYKSNNPNFGYNNSIGGENPNEGHRADEAEKAYRSLTHKGIKMSEEGKSNIRAAKKGKPNGKAGYLGIKSGNTHIVYQIDPRTNNVLHVYNGYDEMNRETGFAQTPVRETAKGIRKRAYGYYWKAEKREKA